MTNRRPKCRIPRNLHERQGFPLLSVLMFCLANMAFGFFLHNYDFPNFAWILAVAYIFLECSALSVAWRPARDLALLGFQSDVGYTFMALAIASFAVVVVAWIQISTYFLMMICAAVLLRVKLYTRRGGPIASFLIMLAAALTGFGISWLPEVITGGQLAFLLQGRL